MRPNRMTVRRTPTLLTRHSVGKEVSDKSGIARGVFQIQIVEIIAASTQVALCVPTRHLEQRHVEKRHTGHVDLTWSSVTSFETSAPHMF